MITDDDLLILEIRGVLTRLATEVNECWGFVGFFKIKENDPLVVKLKQFCLVSEIDFVKLGDDIVVGLYTQNSGSGFYLRFGDALPLGSYRYEDWCVLQKIDKEYIKMHNPEYLEYTMVQGLKK